MNKQTQELFNVIKTVKTLDELKQYDVEGVDWKVMTEYGDTIAHLYALNENATIEGFEYLFDKGVDLKAENEWGQTIAHYYAYNKNENETVKEYLQNKNKYKPNDFIIIDIKDNIIEVIVSEYLSYSEMSEDDFFEYLHSGICIYRDWNGGIKHEAEDNIYTMLNREEFDEIIKENCALYYDSIRQN